MIDWFLREINAPLDGFDVLVLLVWVFLLWPAEYDPLIWFREWLNRR